MINKIIFLAIDILVIFGKQCLGDAGHVIKFELLNSLAKQHTQLEILIYYTNKQLINI